MAPHMYDEPTGSPPRGNSPGGISTPESSFTVQCSDTPEPIAIVGMSCRLPGDVKSASDLWQLLMSQGSGHSKVPASRWNIDAFYHPNGGEKIGSMSMNSGYFIHEDLREFENSFFGINNIEATFMDPQQRKLLELTYECLENAGVRLDQVSGQPIGVFVGSFTLDYWMMQTRDPDYLHRYHATGMGTTILSNRISHALNLTGPSFTLDTGCSASLYSLHQACSALDAGECDAAIVAASNLMQSPEQQLGTMKAGVLSPTGTCHTFDDTADGYGRADGLACLYLKKLSKAIADGDPIRSIIRGSAVNANGKTPGISLPSADGQEAVIRKAYAKAGLKDFSETDYVECHGTGTPVGDPIEVEAVGRVFQRTQATSRPLLIGSVKTNLGHSEATSGLSSIIKATLALENEVLPATIGVKNINPKIKTEEWGVKIVTNTTPWPLTSHETRRIGINSFGYGGANSHCILDAAKAHIGPKPEVSSEALSQLKSSFLIPLSASTELALRTQESRLVSVAASNLNIVDLAHTLGNRRTRLAQRSFTVAGQKSLGEDLSDPWKDNLVGNFSELPIAFVFTGQGAQWPQMTKEVIEEFPSFRQTIDELDAVLQALPERPEWTILQALMDPKETSQISHVTRSQPVCTAIQIAFVSLLRKWGINPVGVVGHSSGEICAAYASGRLTAAQAITVAYYRGYVVGKSQSLVPGAMMAVSLHKDIAASEIDSLRLTEKIKVACINSPESVTISGDEDGIDVFKTELDSRGVFARKLNTNGRAYHSHHMSLLGAEYQSLLDNSIGLEASPEIASDVKWVSSVFGETISGKILPSYWRNNLESPVRFDDAVGGLVKGRQLHFVEIGPHSAMELPIKQICKSLKINDSKFHYTTALTRGKNGAHCILNLIGNLFLHGHNVDFGKVNLVETLASSSRQGEVLTTLPPYPWTYDGLLVNESRQSKELRNREYPHHDLLGIRTIGGNGHDFIWRNTIRVKDIPWVESHKLGQEVVFPGAGYLAMAIEAVSQTTGVKKADGPTVTLRQVNITKALPLSTDENSPGVEVFTTLNSTKISGTGKSATWYDFEISSYENDKSTTHATGSIAIQPAAPITSKIALGEVEFHSLATRNWYDKLAITGLNFGPDFQSMEKIETDRKSSAMRARSTVTYQTGGGSGVDTQSDYIMHPITIDSLLQTALIASSSGVLSKVTCKVPTAIEIACFRAPASDVTKAGWTVDAISNPVGPGTIQISAEIHKDGKVCGQFINVSAVAFQGAMQDESDLDGRHPMMKALWKPDITKITPRTAAAFSPFLSEAANPAPDSQYPLEEGHLYKLAAMVGIVAHKKPRVNILELGMPSPAFTKHLLGDVLRSETSFKRCASYTRGFFNHANGELSAEDMESIASVTDSFERLQPRPGAKFDLILFPNALDETEYTVERFTMVKAFLNPGGVVVARLPSRIPLEGPGEAVGLSMLEVPESNSSERIVIAKLSVPRENEVEFEQRHIVLVERGTENSLNDHLIPRISAHFGQDIRRIDFNKLAATDITTHTTVISTIELHKPLLCTMSVEEMTSLKYITDSAKNLLWLTGGDQINASRPLFAMVSGFSRSLILEQPALRFYTFDIDNVNTHLDLTVENMITTIEELLSDDIPDSETVQKHGVAHISRFVPEEGLNATFRQKQGERPSLKPLAEVSSARLTIKSLGQFDTLAFKEDPPKNEELNTGFVEVVVKSIGLNAKDVFVFSGKVDTRNATTSLECSGVVSKVGPGVTSLKTGDRVVVLAPGNFATCERVPEWACAKLLDSEDFNAMSTLPLVFATAVYGLLDRAQLCEGETVLIHSGAGGVGIAAIQIAQMQGAEIFTTVSTEAKRQYLIKNFGIKPENIFNSRDSSFLEGVLAATNGKGVDVVLNSLTGDLLHDSWRACARFGKFVEIGKRDLTDSGRLDMQMFKRNVTFSAFDVSELYDLTNPKLSKVWRRLLTQVLALYRHGRIQAFSPLKVFDVGEITQAFRYFSTKDRMGKIAISLENPGSLISVSPSKYDIILSPTKSYVLSGCLGGIGRSISKWMIERGARKFVFIGRSGLDKLPARSLVKDLEEAGAHVQVFRGDVGNSEDVKSAVALVQGKIGGVIQAAMGLDEHIFTTMPNASWHCSVNPKVQGSMNLHEAIKGKDDELDFFLMTSSVAGSVGTATESNYTSANSFLDNFAKYRRSQGLPATAIGLGMIAEVGYLHENPEIEAVLLRKGIQPIKEEELLSIIDLSLTRPNVTLVEDAHVLTGLETQGMKKLRQQGFEGTIPTLNDPRAAILASSLDGESDAHSKKSDSGLPPALAEVVDAGGDDEEILEAITSLVVQRLANLILVQAHKIGKTVPLSSWGMDSMLAAEFRTWFFMAFAVDIPFLMIMSEEVNPALLAEKVKVDMVAAGRFTIG